jgi:hypothetical protein
MFSESITHCVESVFLLWIIVGVICARANNAPKIGWIARIVKKPLPLHPPFPQATTVTILCPMRLTYLNENRLYLNPSSQKYTHLTNGEIGSFYVDMQATIVIDLKTELGQPICRRGDGPHVSVTLANVRSNFPPRILALTFGAAGGIIFDMPIGVVASLCPSPTSGSHHDIML